MTIKNMSTPLFFNPAKISLAAKAWECLRRNEPFKELVRSYFLTPESERWPQTQLFVHAENNCNTIARAAFDYIAFYHDPEEPTLPLWSALPWQLKEKLERSVEWEIGEGLPAMIEFASLSLRHGDKGLEIRCGPMKFIRSDQYLLIAVPKRIRDKKHRAEIITNISELIPTPFADARSLEGRGRVLGTEKQWDAFLRYELWKECDFGRGIAAKLVSAERRENEKFGNTQRSRLAKAKKYLKENPKRPKSAYDFECDFEVIESAIDGVFPKFSAYSKPA